MQKHGFSKQTPRYKHFPPGYENRKRGADKIIERPPTCCFHCGEAGHLRAACPRAGMPKTPEGENEMNKFNEYKRKCDAANEVYFVDFQNLMHVNESANGPGYMETGMVSPEYNRDIKIEDDPDPDTSTCDCTEELEPKYQKWLMTSSSTKDDMDPPQARGPTSKLDPPQVPGPSNKPSIGAPPPPQRKHVHFTRTPFDTSNTSASFSSQSSSSSSSSSSGSKLNLTTEEEIRRLELMKKLRTPSSTRNPHFHHPSATPIRNPPFKFITQPPSAEDLHKDDPAYSEDPVQTFIANSHTLFDDPCIPPPKETDPLIPPTTVTKILDRPKKIKNEYCALHKGRVLCDCGAPDHACMSAEGMLNLRPPDDGETASNASGTKMTIDAVGDVPLADDLTMKNARVIPELQQDLFSLAKAEDDWQTLSILGDNRIILYDGPVHLDPAHIRAVGYREGGHYFIDQEEFQRRSEYNRQATSPTPKSDYIAMNPKKKSFSANPPSTYVVSSESRDDDKRQKLHNSQYFFTDNGLYSFENGDGKIYEQLTTAESLERPIPRPAQKKSSKNKRLCGTHAIVTSLD
jgi:hypothetical protein